MRVYVRIILFSVSSSLGARRPGDLGRLRSRGCRGGHVVVVAPDANGGGDAAGGGPPQAAQGQGVQVRRGRKGVSGGSNGRSRKQFGRRLVIEREMHIHFKTSL
jgi:hypothetical protein